MIVEPIAADNPAENLGNPVSRLYYNASTMICVPTSLAQEVGTALGAQAGEAKLAEILKEGGFRQVLLRGDTDFSQTKHLDRWHADPRARFLFGLDQTAARHVLADDLQDAAWQELQWTAPAANLDWPLCAQP